MRIAIIGAGFTGLSAAYYLSKKGYDVSIFEKESLPGGLAIGYKKDNWEWPLEAHYHHLFTSDNHIIELAQQVGVEILFKRPITSTLYNKNLYQLDSPLTLLSFPPLSLISRLRTGVGLLGLKINPFWHPLERLTAKKFLIAVMGKASWKVLWEPLFSNKFGDKYKNEIPASWFWARIKKRSSSLGYPYGGFLNLAKVLSQQIEKQRGKIFYNQTLNKITKKDNKFFINDEPFDYLISTIPLSLFGNIFPQLEIATKPIPMIGAINLVLRLKKPFLLNNTYWVNVNEKDFPFLAIVEHTNFMNHNHYGKEHLVYVGKYIDSQEPFFEKSKEDLLQTYTPFLKKINPSFSENLIGYDVFKAKFAQPIVPLNYSQFIPPMKTNIKNLILATMQQVYPWDRGTNYAVEIGKKAADIILKE